MLACMYTFVCVYMQIHLYTSLSLSPSMPVSLSNSLLLALSPSRSHSLALHSYICDMCTSVIYIHISPSIYPCLSHLSLSLSLSLSPPLSLSLSPFLTLSVYIYVYMSMNMYEHIALQSLQPKPAIQNLRMNIIGKPAPSISIYLCPPSPFVSHSRSLPLSPSLPSFLSLCLSLSIYICIYVCIVMSMHTHIGMQSLQPTPGNPKPANQDCWRTKTIGLLHHLPPGENVWTLLLLFFFGRSTSSAHECANFG